MRKNRTAYFLVISFAILSLVFYKLLNNNPKEGEKEKDQTEEAASNDSTQEKETQKEVITQKQETVNTNPKGETNNNPPIPENDQDKEWKEFNTNERKLLRSGYQVGEGSQGDDVKYLVNPDGDEIQYFKKKKAKKLTIDVGLKMPKQNYFVWNQLVSDEDLEVEIEIDNGEDNPIRERIPSNQNFFSFKTQNSRYDGVDCRVTLNIIPKDGITIKGKLTGVFTTKCGK